MAVRLISRAMQVGYRGEDEVEEEDDSTSILATKNLLFLSRHITNGRCIGDYFCLPPRRSPLRENGTGFFLHLPGSHITR